MREVIFGTILVGAAAAGVYFMPLGSANDGASYAMSVKDAKLLLGKADLRVGKVPFGRLDVVVTSPSDNVVSYAASGSFAALDCRATLHPVDGGVTVDTNCDGGSASDGASASAVKDLNNLAFAEFVDAALDRRAYDDEKIQMQSAGAVFKNLGGMQRDALKMQRETQQGINQMDSGEPPMDDGAVDDGDQGSTADYGSE